MTAPPETDRTWTVIEGLSPGVYYEVRVVARNGKGNHVLKTNSPSRKILMGQRKGKSIN